MALLEVVGLSKVFRHHWTMRSIPVLEDVSLSLREGEILGLVGPNGAGKTTTIKLILALLRPTRGRVEFLGRPVGRPQTRQGIGFLPEQPYFYDYLTVEETLRFYAQLYGLRADHRRQRIAELIERLQLGPFQHRTVRQLSKGNLQRVGIAQAILHHPKLAILDEPMSGLDPMGRKEMHELIGALRDEGTTVIFSSHILPDTEALCDRVALIVAGKLREVVDIASNEPPQGPFVATVSRVSPVTFAALAALALPPVSGGPRQWLFRFPDRDTVRRALALIVQANGFLESLAPEQLSLEQRLLSYVGGELRTP